MRDRNEIEKDADEAQPGPDSKVGHRQLVLEVLLDIRDQLVNISTKQSHLIEGVGLLRDIQKDIATSGRAHLRASR